MFSSATITAVLDFFFPPLCVHCRREGFWLCPPAWRELASSPELIDPVQIPGVDRVVCRGSYDLPTLQRLVTTIKYSYWSAAGRVLPDVLAPLQSELEKIDPTSVIIPVPLHTRRRRERGFNQSDLIAQALADMTGRPVANVLERTRHTTSQAKLSAVRRINNVVGAFDQRGVSAWPKAVILVDDVITTGSTIAECARVLRQHGVQKITAVALAKG